MINVGMSTLTMIPSAMTGTASYVRGLVAELSARDRGVRITMLVNPLLVDWATSIAQRNVEVHPMPGFRLRDAPRSRLAAVGRAWINPGRLARAVPADLDLVHYPLTLPLPATAKPTVLSLHDVQHHDMPELFSSVQRRWRRRAYDDPARRATTVMTISEHSKARIVECLKVAPERIEVAHHGVDSSRFDPSARADDKMLLASLDLPETFVFYPAALWPHKNHSRLLEALALLDNREIGLVLTGPGSNRLAGFRAHARRLGVGDRVRHLGFLPQGLLPPILRRASALVFPSLYEGFGMPVVEAMAAGCPVAAAAIPTLEEVCGGAALMFDPRAPEEMAKAIERVVGDDALRSRLRAAGYERAGHFTWSACADRHAEIFRRTLERAQA